MLYPSKLIFQHLKSLGLKENDTVMIHADAGIAMQYQFKGVDNPISEYINELLRYFYEGTVIVPTFTYSATKGEIFDPNIIPSNVGIFSERFRLMNVSVRSNHPIFSISSVGKNSNYFINSKLTDCFGKETFFEKLLLKNVKLITFGCKLDRLTFIHYVEQNLKVSYRYFKNFKGSIFCNGETSELDVRYFVRKMNLNTALDLSLLEKQAIIMKKLIKKPLGKFLARVINAKDLFEIAKELINKDEFSLIKQEKN